ncbi:MAG TPA: hypothetical protein HA347_05865 [Nitrosopumilus sp.]|jgi:hypothetical protein|nr:MAG: hypothetical protein ABR52_02620 [Nitrosopumilus sp. BACL13 MAG-120910-bin56]HIH98875.1 hypothetical protein [Nitrosopumilus sp.]HII05480.1 hypothetical protein [Nitrosopumilus sp.]
MVSKRLFVVFILPIIFSVIVGSIVMADTLQKPDRELNMWPMSNSETSHSSSIQIIGLSSQYSVSESIEINVKISDSSFNCGDLYITIYNSEKSNVITQGAFFEQCFNSESNLIPIDDKFSKVINTPGSYDLVVDMVSKDLSNISTSGIFTVK